MHLLLEIRWLSINRHAFWKLTMMHSMFMHVWQPKKNIVGGFNPSENITVVKLDHFPKLGMKSRQIGSFPEKHHPEIACRNFPIFHSWHLVKR